MSFFSFTPEELSQLTGLRREAQLVYLKVIVPNRNRKTGVAVGRLPDAPYQLTYPGMQHALTVDGRQGVKANVVDKQFCRRVIGELERAGLVRKVGADLLSGLECLIFNESKDLHYSAHKKPDTKSTPKPDTKSTLIDSYNSDTCGDFQYKQDTPKTGKPDTFTEDTEVKDASLPGACAMNDLQESYWRSIQQCGSKITLAMLTNPSKQEAYRRLLARWEAEKVDPKLLPTYLKTILNEQQQRGDQPARSPLYFEEPVLRLAGESHGKPATTKRYPAKKAASVAIYDYKQRFAIQAQQSDVRPDPRIVGDYGSGVSGAVDECRR